MAALDIEAMPPRELGEELLRLSGIVRRSEVVDGARIVAALKAAAGFLLESD